MKPSGSEGSIGERAPHHTFVHIKTSRGAHDVLLRSFIVDASVDKSEPTLLLQSVTRTRTIILVTFYMQDSSLCDVKMSKSYKTSTVQ